MGRFPRTAKPPYQHGALLLIVLIGLGLRLYDLGAESFWRDEISSLQAAQLDLRQIIDDRSASFHPPFYYFVLHYWLKLFGSSEFAARLLSALCSTLSIVLICRVGTLLFGERLGLLSALIFALAEFQVHYAQEVKGYALFTLLNLCSFYFFILLLQHRAKSHALGYVFSTVLLLYTHAYGLFSLAAQNLYLFSTCLFSNRVPRSELRRWLGLQGLLLLLFVPWLSFLIDQVDRLQGGYWRAPPTFSSLRKTFSAYSGSNLSLVLFSAVASLPFLVRSRLRDSADEHLSRLGNPVALVVAWLAIPILTPFVLSLFVMPVYLTRGTVGASCAFYLLVAKGVESVRASTVAALFLVGLIGIFSAVNVLQYYAKPTREQWREVVRTVDTQAQEEDLMLFQPAFCQIPFAYYSARTDVEHRPLSTYLGKGEQKEPPPSLPPRVWLVLCDNQHPDEHLLKRLTTGYRRISYEEYFGIDVAFFARTNAQ